MMGASNTSPSECPFFNLPCTSLGKDNDQSGLFYLTGKIWGKIYSNVKLSMLADLTLPKYPKEITAGINKKGLYVTTKTQDHPYSNH